MGDEVCRVFRLEQERFVKWEDGVCTDAGVFGMCPPEVESRLQMT